MSEDRRVSTLTVSTTGQTNPSPRKMSVMNSRKLSVFSQRTSTANFPNKIREQATCQLGPVAKFDRDLVEKIVKERVDAFINVTEETKILTDLQASKQLSNDIRQTIKGEHFDRYKILSYVVVGQNLEQAVQVSSSAMWNHVTDDYVSVSVVKEDFFVVAIVFGVYLD